MDHRLPEHRLPQLDPWPPGCMDTAEYGCGHVDGHTQAHTDCLAWRPGAHPDGCRRCPPVPQLRHSTRASTVLVRACPGPLTRRRGWLLLAGLRRRVAGQEERNSGLFPGLPTNTIFRRRSLVG